MKKETIFYEENEREFYKVTETPKQFKIDWIPKESGEYILDSNVRWKNIIVKKENNRKHCLRRYSDDEIIIYPFQEGLPFVLNKATEEYLDMEIESCKKWGVSSGYYEDIKKEVLRGK